YWSCVLSCPSDKQSSLRSGALFTSKHNEYFNTKSYARTADVQELPSLIEVQLQSFQWFLEEGLKELFDEISPIESFNGNLRLYFPGNSPEAEQFGLKYWF